MGVLQINRPGKIERHFSELVRSNDRFGAGYRVTTMASNDKEAQALVSHERVLGSILLIRGEKVILDTSLAELYGVETRVLVQAVKRNLARFPDDFMFQLSKAEFDALRSQNVMSRRWGGRRTPPYAFTEQGVAMLSSILKSRRAIAVNVEVMRAFVRLRRLAEEHRDVLARIDELERRYDRQFAAVFDAIRALISEKTQPARRIGFQGKEHDQE